MRLKSIFIFLSFLMLSSCSVKTMVQTDLYFGLSKPDGGNITTAEWNDFVSKDISVVYPSGFSIIESQGKWLDPDTKQLITEPSFIVSVIYNKDIRLSKRIDSLRTAYKSRFNQQSVLRVDKKIQAKF